MEINEQTELLREMRDLLRVMAEPALAKRDERLRSLLREEVGRSKSKAKAILLMDGSRSRAVISKDSGIDGGDLSRLMKALIGKGLIMEDAKQPKLVISLPPNFFENTETQNG